MNRDTGWRERGWTEAAEVKISAVALRVRCRGHSPEGERGGGRVVENERRAGQTLPGEDRVALQRRALSWGNIAALDPSRLV